MSKPRGIRAPAVASLVLALLAFAVFFAAMAYPWHLAFMAGAAIGLLVYSTHATWQRMRPLYRQPDENDLNIGGHQSDYRGKD